MKYVRTNYGIYKTEKYCEIRRVINIDGTFYLIINVEGIYEKIIKEADNLEELCDEFVIKIGNTYEVTNEFDVNDIVWGDNTQELYGAIWTDKGLKYVAKLNKDGELELL